MKIQINIFGKVMKIVSVTALLLLLTVLYNSVSAQTVINYHILKTITSVEDNDVVIQVEKQSATDDLNGKILTFKVTPTEAADVEDIQSAGTGTTPNPIITQSTTTYKTFNYTVSTSANIFDIPLFKIVEVTKKTVSRQFKVEIQTYTDSPTTYETKYSDITGTTDLEFLDITVNNDDIEVSFENNIATAAKQVDENAILELVLKIKGAITAIDQTVLIKLEKPTGSSITLPSSADDDFKARTGASPTVISVTIPDGNYTSEQTLRVTEFVLNNDNVIENDETFTATLTKGATNSDLISLGKSVQAVTIVNDDKLTVEFAAATASQLESVVNPLKLKLTGAVVVPGVSLSVNIGITQVAGFSLPDGVTGGNYTVAINAADYTQSANQNVTVTGLSINNNSKIEADKKFVAKISIPTTETRIDLGSRIQQTMTITDDDKLTVAFAEATASPLESVVNPLKLKLTGADVATGASLTVKINLTTSIIGFTLPAAFVEVTIPDKDYTDTANQDLVVTGLTFTEDRMVGTVNRRFTATISESRLDSRIQLGLKEQVVTIIDDDISVFFSGPDKNINEKISTTLPRIPVLALSVFGANTTKDQTVLVTLTKSMVSSITLPRSTEGDFKARTAASPTVISVTIPAGNYKKLAVKVPVIGLEINDDDIIEGNEKFTATLSIGTTNSELVSIGQSVQEVTIEDDDKLSVEFVGNVLNSIPPTKDVSEVFTGPLFVLKVTGGESVIDQSVDITLKKTTGSSITLPSITNGDFKARAGASPTVISVTIPAKDYSLSANQTINVTAVELFNDNIVEGDEEVVAELSTSSSNISLPSVPSSVLKILNDDKIEIGFDVSGDINVNEADQTDPNVVPTNFRISNYFALIQCSGTGAGAVYNNCIDASLDGKVFIDIEITSPDAIFKTSEESLDGDYVIGDTVKIVSTTPPADVKDDRKSVIVRVPLFDTVITPTNLPTTSITVSDGFFKLLNDNVIDAIDGAEVEKINFKILENQWTKPATTDTKVIGGNTVNTRSGYTMNVTDDDILAVQMISTNSNAIEGQTNDQNIVSISGGKINSDLTLSFRINFIGIVKDAPTVATVGGNSFNIDGQQGKVTIPKGDYSTNTGYLTLNQFFTLVDDGVKKKQYPDVKITLLNIKKGNTLLYEPGASTTFLTFNNQDTVTVAVYEQGLSAITWKKNNINYYEKDNANVTIYKGETSEFPVLEWINTPSEKVDLVVFYTDSDIKNPGGGLIEQQTTRISNFKGTERQYSVQYDFDVDDKYAREKLERVLKIIRFKIIYGPTELYIEVSNTKDLTKDITLTTGTTGTTNEYVFFTNFDTLTANIFNDDFLKVEFSAPTYTATEAKAGAITDPTLPILTVSGAKVKSPFNLEIQATVVGIKNAITVPVEIPAGNYTTGSSINLKLGDIVKDDKILEADKTVKLDMINPASFINRSTDGSEQITTGNNPASNSDSNYHQLTSSFTIQDDDSLTLAFDKDVYRYKENGDSSDPTKIGVHISGGENKEDMYVFVTFTPTGAASATDPGSAASGSADSDFNKSKILVNIPKKDYSKNEETIYVPMDNQIVADNVVEEDETIKLNLDKNVVKADLGSNPLSSLQPKIKFAVPRTISGTLPTTTNVDALYYIENDDKLTVGFAETTQSFPEGGVPAGEKGVINLTISGAEIKEGFKVNLKIVYPTTSDGNKVPALASDVALQTGTGASNTNLQNIEVTIPKGNYPKDNPGSKNIYNNIDFKEDKEIENVEYFELKLEIPPTLTEKLSFGKDESDKDKDVSKITLTDDDKLTIEFESVKTGGPEDDTSRTSFPMLKVSGADLKTGFDVEVIIIACTNNDGSGNSASTSDYKITSTVDSKCIFDINIPAKVYTSSGDHLISLGFSVEPDDYLEKDETIVFSLKQPSEAAQWSLGSNETTTHTIENDDFLKIEFKKTGFSDIEGESSDVPVLVMSGAKTFQEIPMNIKVTPVITNSTGIAGSINDKDSPKKDYVFTPTTDAGENIKTIQIPELTTTASTEISLSNILQIVDDRYLEDDEVLNLTISNPKRTTSVINYSAVNTAASSPTTTSTYKIENNDFLYVSFTKESFSGKEGDPGSPANEDLPTLSVRGAIVSAAQIGAGGLTVALRTMKIEFTQPNSDDYSLNGTTMNAASETIDIVIPGDDYTSLKTIAIPFKPVADKDLEKNEEITMKLLRVTGAMPGATPNLGTQKYINYDVSGKSQIKQASNAVSLVLNAKYEIINDDFLTVQFSNVSETNDEGAIDPNTKVGYIPKLSVSGGILESDITIPISVTTELKNKAEFGIDYDFTSNFDATKKTLSFTIAADDYSNDTTPKSLPLTDFVVINDNYLETDEVVNFRILSEDIDKNTFVNINTDGSIATIDNNPSSSGLTLSTKWIIKNDDILSVTFDKTVYGAKEDTNGDHPQLKITGARTKIAYDIKVLVSPKDPLTTNLVTHANIDERKTDEDYIMNGDINNEGINKEINKAIIVRIPVISVLPDAVKGLLVPIEGFEITPDKFVEADEILEFSLDVKDPVVVSDSDKKIISGHPGILPGTTTSVDYIIENDDKLVVSFTEDKYESEEDAVDATATEDATGSIDANGAFSPTTTFNKKQVVPKLNVSGVVISESYTIYIKIAPKPNVKDKDKFEPVPPNTGETNPDDNPVDYTINDKTTSVTSQRILIEIPAGDYTTQKVFFIDKTAFATVPDKYIEDDEIVLLTLEKVKDQSYNDNILLGKPSITSNERVIKSEYVIKNDDTMTVRFSESEYAKNENGPEGAPFVIIADGADLLEDVKLTITVTPGSDETIFGDTTNTSLNDYTLDRNAEKSTLLGNFIIDGSNNIALITIPANNYFSTPYEKTYNMEYIKDNRLENDEFIELSLKLDKDASSEINRNVRIGQIENNIKTKHRAKMVITNDDFITVSFQDRVDDPSAIQLEDSNPTIIPKIEIKGADLSGYKGAISFFITLDSKSSITNGEDFTELPVKIELAEAQKIDLTIESNQVFDINDLIKDEAKKLKIINDSVAENNETLILKLDVPVNVTIDQNNKTKKITIIDDEPNAGNSILGSSRISANADGYDTITLRVTLKNGQNEILQYNKNRNLQIYADVGKEPDLITSDQKKPTYNEAAKRWELKYKYGGKPKTVKFTAKTEINSENIQLGKEVNVTFKGPSSGSFNDNTDNEDTRPELTGNAPFGTIIQEAPGNKVEVIISNSEGKIWERGNIDVTEENSWSVSKDEVKELQDGDYTVTVTVIDPAGNRSLPNRDGRLTVTSVKPQECTLTPTVTYYQRPRLTGTATPKTFIELTIDNVTYNTSPEINKDGNNKILVSEDGTWEIPKDVILPLNRNHKYDVSIILVTKSNKKSEKFEFNQVVHITDYPITTNEGFSPNGDNVNDTWYIADIEDYPNNKVTIFNRWGNIVWEKEGYENDEGWTGESRSTLLSSGGALPGSVYFYVIDLKNGNEPITGFITVAN